MRLLAILIGAVVLGLDQVTKAWVLDVLGQSGPIAVAPFLNMVLVWNTGISFGLFQGWGEAGRWALAVMASLIAGGVLLYLWRERRLLSQLALWLIVAGAIGNLIDRLRFGAVVDFIDFHVLGYHWPAFNIADSAIVVGAGLLLIDGLLFSTATPNDGPDALREDR